MKLLLLILCFFAPLYLASALSSDGLTLLSLLKHWTVVPPSISSSWKASDSTPCSWLGVQCDHDSHVVSLNLTASRINGQLGLEIGNLNHLQTLMLFTNGFSGAIPPELGNCSQLKYIDLSENYFSGHIPLSIWKIQSLKYILVHNNSLFGELPSEMTELKHLKNISLFDNQFSGDIPQSLGINSKLVKLDLMNNKFTGKIPPNLCFGKQLRVLNVGLNQLQGGIPPDVGKCATLGRLVLNKNNLTGSLPDFESNMNLIYIDISKNNISGTIPSSLGNCRNLTAIILSMNIITGLIPSELGNLVNLQALNLAHNNLEGPLPKKLSYCTKMEKFDVGFNFLNGSFPSSLSSWTRINTLNVSENRFSGVIPAFLLEFEQIIELQIGGNMFEGNIPSIMVTRPNLLYQLNLSANRLTGEVPPEIGMFIMLHTLDVSLNNLTGSINVFGELLSLTEVNISHNSFFGPVPEALKEYLSFSPSSFLDNPGLCVNCSASDDLSCTKTSYLKLKPCDLELEYHKGIVKRFIPLIVLLPLVFCSLVLGLLIVCKSPSVSVVKEHRLIDLRYKWQVMKATKNLNDGYIIGRGAHGIVYKAKLYYGVLAVKKLVIAGSERKRLRMIKEIEIVRKTRHQNVATFLGSWIGKEYGLIFYKYMENGSLHDVLHENDPPTSLDWNVRYKIAVGIAKGLAYLHHICDPPILHRDIKPKNILLDSDMEPCITDFGISIALNQSSTVMHMRSTYHLGTRGFMAPEIAYTVVPSCEFDVYSYGVVLLELITRKKVLDSSFEEEGTTLVGWFKSVWRETREIEEIVDSSLAKELSDSNVVVQIIKVLLVALICTDTDPGKRLKMTDVIKFYEAPTVQGIFVQDDRTSFHLGNALAAAFAFISIPKVKTFAIEGEPFLLNEVMEATENLNDKYVIGRGARAIVYKVSQHSFQNFALKKLAFAVNKGMNSNIFREIQPLGNIRHRNLVALLQFWVGRDCVLFLYWYMPNGSLHDVLHEKNPPPSVEWNVRFKIAIGIAHGLAYLHCDCNPPIVHRNIKPKNILLDADMEPHIADFGIAKTLDQTSASAPSISVPGTVGYIAPENAYTTANNRESDVYSYGVVLLELITRKKAVDPTFMEGVDIVSWVRTLRGQTEDIGEIVDSSLANELLDSNILEQVNKVLLVALRCTEKIHKRPTMRDVIKQLEDANPRTGSRKS